jgi:acyl-CoA thioesterase
VHWTAHLVGPIPESGAWLRFRAVPVSAAEGYVTTRGHLWNVDGELVAWMEQLVMVFDRPS